MIRDGNGLPSEIAAFIDRHGLGPATSATRLTGGVSSDIWRVFTPSGEFCVKRALAKLRVAQDWRAPTERNRYEARWYRTIGSIVPGIAPRVLAEDEAAGLFAMEFLPPERHALWKAELLAGRIAIAPFGDLGVAVGRIHAATANSEAIRRQFETGAIFEEIRLSPYLRATAARHPDLGNSLHALADRTAATRIALVHGDLSPKNILTGEQGVTILDAECAWYGDPAFDPAFFLNHILLKTAHMPQHAEPLLSGFEAFWTSYLAQATWEPVEALSMRTAGLLGGLLLARIDGKSPVEYIIDPATKDRVRRIARDLIARPRREPMDIAEIFRNPKGRL